jgi:hypothetical protein
MTGTSDKRIIMTIRDFTAVCLFVIGIGISIGGFIKVLNDFEKLDAKIDKLSDSVAKIQEQNGELRGAISQLHKR